MTGPGDRDGVGRCPTLAGTSDLAGNGFLDVTTPQLPATLGHSLTRMTGRDPNEPHRTATPLELLFDLAFVAAFGQAADQLAHLVAEGHLGSGIGGFAFAMFAICWAWINFTWFASAYDTDDWFFRITTMVQMVGVVVLALGMPPVFHSIDEGHTLDNRVMVAGYVIMRVAMVAQWLRAAKQDPSRRRIALSYAGFIVVAQVGWVVLAVLHLDLGPTFAVAAVLYLIEVGGPVMAERIGATGSGSTTPWHAHHIAERYGLLTIIALGEGVFGTIASVSAVVEGQGWTLDAAIVAVAGVGLTFGLWWAYFTLPSGSDPAPFPRAGPGSGATATSWSSPRSRPPAPDCTWLRSWWRARPTSASRPRCSRWRSRCWCTWSPCSRCTPICSGRSIPSTSVCSSAPSPSSCSAWCWPRPVSRCRCA